MLLFKEGIIMIYNICGKTNVFSKAKIENLTRMKFAGKPLSCLVQVKHSTCIIQKNKNCENLSQSGWNISEESSSHPSTMYADYSYTRLIISQCNSLSQIFCLLVTLSIHTQKVWMKATQCQQNRNRQFIAEIRF